jgi:two-component system cell cycle sensor histidine kinase/response regulator CckA
LMPSDHRNGVLTNPWIGTVFIAVFWTVCVVASVLWNMRGKQDEAKELALIEARASIVKDLVYRRWVSDHGGVYVPVSAETPPNPYLAHVAGKDVVTSSGSRLILVNPEYLMRQVFELANRQDGSRVHITSLDPIRPENGADRWETIALDAFQRGRKEIHSVEILDGKPFLRLMRPFVTEESCIKCHGAQGYKPGDIRGGISTSVPMAPFNAVAGEDIRKMVLGHAGIWVVGMALLWSGSLILRRYEKEREKAGSVLDAERDRIKAIFTANPDLLFQKDRRSVYLTVNPAFCRFLGRREDEILGKTDLDLFPAEEAERNRADDAKVMGSGRTQSRDELNSTGEGKRWHQVTKTPLRDASGSVTGVLCSIRDITDRKQAEEIQRREIDIQRILNRIMRRSHESSTLDELLDFALQQILSLEWLAIEGRGAVFTCDDASGRLVMRAQRNLPEVLRKSCASLSFGECLCGLAAGRKEIVFADTVDARHEISYEGMAPHGHYCIPILVNGNVVGVLNLYIVRGHGRRANEEGYLRLFADTLGIIIARKGAEEMLQEREERYRSLVEASTDMIAVHVDGKYVYVNPAGVKLLGAREAGDLIGKPFIDFVHPDARETVRERVRNIKEGIPAPMLEERLIRRDGSEFDADVIGVPLRYEGRSATQIIVRDITDQKRAEVEKDRLQAQLQQAMKMEAVGRLAGGVAHDFNNLLTAIIGNVSLTLMKFPPSDPLARMLSTANKAAERAATLIQQLLAFSRKQIIEPKILNLDDLIADMHPMLDRLIGEDVEIRTVTGRELGSVKVDPGQFEQILFNLVVNARDAMPDGGEIVIETSNVDLDDGYCAVHPYVKPGLFVMLALSDTGHGISEEVKPHIFEPFFTTKPKGIGTGLGLATSYGAVKQAGGSIEVFSEVGKGTTFKIYLPRVGEMASEQGSGDQLTDMPGGTETVLFAEDEDMVRDLGVSILKQLGYRVLHAANGHDAIALAGKYRGRIDLLLTDVVMPGMSGRELATLLVLHRPEMEVLFTSGYTDDAIVRHGVRDDGVLFIGKPYTPSALARKVREVLDKA